MLAASRKGYHAATPSRPTVDATDIRIIRAMGLQPYGRHPRPPAVFRPRNIAKQVGVSVGAVRDRVSKMEASGVVDGYEICPNLRLMGYESSCYYLKFEDHADVDGFAGKVQSVEGVVGIYTFTEPDMCINIAYRTPSDLHRKLNLLIGLAGKAELVKFYDLEMPPAARPLSRLDWRIIKALRGKALRPLSEVADELGVSAKTVKRRFDRMGGEGAFFIIPLVDPAKVPGLILFELIVWLDAEAGPATFQSVLRALDDNQVCVDFPTSPEYGNYGVGLYAQRLGDIEACRKKAAAVRGVKRVRPIILQGSEERFDWMDEVIDRMARGAGAP